MRKTQAVLDQYDFKNGSHRYSTNTMHAWLPFVGHKSGGIIGKLDDLIGADGKYRNGLISRAGARSTGPTQSFDS